MDEIIYKLNEKKLMDQLKKWFQIRREQKIEKWYLMQVDGQQTTEDISLGQGAGVVSGVAADLTEGPEIHKTR